MEEKDSRNFFEEFIPQIKNLVQAETVFGEPYQVGEVTLIPVNSVKIGFGFGGNKLTKSDNQGDGGGVLLTPVAFVVIKGGEVNIHNLNAGTIENVMAKAPDLVERFLNMINKGPKENSTTP